MACGEGRFVYHVLEDISDDAVTQHWVLVAMRETV